MRKAGDEGRPFVIRKAGDEQHQATWEKVDAVMTTSSHRSKSNLFYLTLFLITSFFPKEPHASHNIIQHLIASHSIP